MSARLYTPSQGFDLALLHKVGNYTLVALAIVALWTGRALSPALTAVVAAIMTLSWFWEKPRVDPDRFGTMWTALTVLFIGFSIYLGVMTEVGVVQTGVYFVLYLTGAKLFQRVRLDDAIQLLALSFLLLASATAYNEDVLFGAIFALYVVVGVVTFAVYHLRRQIEENASRGGRRVKQLFGPGFLSVLAGLALVCFLAAVAFFFLFPRLGFGFFAQKTRTGVQVSGFSESVDLGQHGSIKSDQTVVMRVQYPNGEPKPNPGLERYRPYWRGISFDYYDGASWSSRLKAKRSLRPDHNWRFSIRRAKNIPPEDIIVQEIYLEPLGSNVIFSIYPPLAMELSQKDKITPAWMRRKGISFSEGETLRHLAGGKVGFQYKVYSLDARYSPDQLRDAVTNDRTIPFGPRNTAAYTQLPEINPKIQQLAEQITAGLTNDYDKAKAIETHLRTNFTYTTDLPDIGGKSPMDAFLFEHQSGHCEYFATAMVVLLRSIKIPSRNVNGFMGGQWNEFDNFFAVRNADAHSWVEVWLDEAGWQPFEPTPPDADVSDRTGFFDPVTKFYDSLRFRWLKYVIEYDLETQIEALRSAANALGGDSEGDSDDPEQFRLTLMDIFMSLRRNFTPAILVFLFSVLGWAGMRLRARHTLSWPDGLIILTTLSLSVGVVLALWRPEAGLLARIYSVALPLLALLAGLAFRQRSRTRLKRHEGVAKLYARLLDMLDDAGLPRRHADGPEATLKRVRASQLPAQDAIERLILRYMATRFGGQRLDDDELRALTRTLKDIRKALRDHTR